MKELIKTLKEYKANYVGELFNETGLDDSLEIILATDDGGDTDLHTCVISNENGAWIKFYVEVDPATGRIVNVDTDCVDYCTESYGEHIDCVKIDDILV